MGPKCYVGKDKSFNIEAHSIIQFFLNICENVIPSILAIGKIFADLQRLVRGFLEFLPLRPNLQFLSCGRKITSGFRIYMSYRFYKSNNKKDLIIAVHGQVVSVSIQLDNHWTDLDEIWYGRPQNSTSG